MIKRKQTVTVFEAHQFTILRQSQNAARLRCTQCALHDSFMVTPDEAAALAHLGLRAIFRLVDAGRVHFLETGEGRLLVCLKSLADYQEESKHESAS